MKKIVFLSVTCLFMLFSMSACRQINGHGPIVHETRSLTGFNSIISEMPTDIYISEGKDFEVELEGQQNILDITESKVEENRLTFRIKKEYSVSGGIHLIIRIKCPEIINLKNAGSGNMEVLNHFQTENLKLSLPGSGNILLAGVWDNQLNISLSGSGNIGVKDGSTKALSCLISGSGNIKTEGLDAKNVHIKISGSGNVFTGISDTLAAQISGSGTIYYKGNPALSQHISGSGSIRKS